MTENLPPLPGSTPEPLKPSLTAYILRGDAWLEIGTATPHPDGKGHRLRLHIAPEDGDVGPSIRAARTAGRAIDCSATGVAAATATR
jgi:hypothetical protein